MEKIEPLISKNDIEKIIEMNCMIIRTNCEILKALSMPLQLVHKGGYDGEE